uniref:Agrin n=1 Tax=Electrophorus electricus TaxID=8005 RepID=A0AAY5EY32_ELEEL
LPPTPCWPDAAPHKVSLVVRYFMIPCNICLILLATSTLGFAVLLFLNNCYTPLPPPPCCRGKLCGFGAVCEKDPSDPSKGECMCKRMACPSVVAPVCGSDSSTYSNECELEKAQCNLQRRIKVMRKGPCGKSLKDPCSEVTCSYGSTCVQSSDGLSAKCMCPLSCEPVPKWVVCGSDGLDYPSECELNTKACSTQKNIRVQHTSPCDPCRDLQRGPDVLCVVNTQTRKPEALVLPEPCPPAPKPLCASDGRSYNSKCQMQRTAVQKRRQLHQVHSGPCRKEEECKEECKYSAVCLLEHGRPRCSCEPIHCDGSYRPLCGQDGLTYPNECERRRAECLSRTPIPVKQQGPCDLNVPSPCLKKTCDFGGTCVVKNGQAVCECPDACPPAQDPVCGSDGHTHNSQCHMRAMGCALQKHIHIQHKGSCDKACGSCTFGAICDGQTGRCVCPTECVGARQPVCGSDGTTYENECELNVRACTKQLDLHVAAQGECKTCGSTVCSWGAHCVQNKCECPLCADQPLKPVCGTDGITYDNHCELQLASCTMRKSVEVAKPGLCDEECGSGGSGSGVEACEQDRCRRFGGSWDEDTEDERCMCGFDCRNVPLDQVCGSDGRTYNNECELKKTRCDKKVDLLLQSQGPCAETRAPSGTTATPVHCSRTVYGCCKDNKTTALGVQMAGCPSKCHCNPYGSYGGACDPTTGQCSCKPGVGGLKCDRCEPGFWNFRAIVTENTSGCTPCNCDAIGSVRDDCEQMTGLCSCKTEVTGPKCDFCPDGRGQPELSGRVVCVADPKVPVSCAHLQCPYGASCVEGGGQARCQCPPPNCDQKNRTKVCGSDGLTYADQCQLRTLACRQDKEITVKHLGHCKGEALSLTLPVSLRNTHTHTHTHTLRQTHHDGSSAENIPQCPRLHFLRAGVDVAGTTLSPVERTSCDNTPFGCCPDGKTTATGPDGTNCPSTMRFNGYLHLDQVEGQEVFYTPEMEDPKSELFGETARSIESALNELFCKSDVQKDFQSVRVRNLAPSNSIVAMVEVHFDPDTRFTVDDIEAALLKQLKLTKGTGIVVKQPAEEYIRFTTTVTTVATSIPTTRSVAVAMPTNPAAARRPASAGRPSTTRRTATSAPVTTTPPRLHAFTTVLPLRTRPVPQHISPCDSQPCSHGGTCEEDGEEFTCTCPAGRGGAVCEKGESSPYYIPSFGGKSYLAFDTMKAYHTVRIAMEFRASDTTGVLLYNGQTGKKDFLSLALVGGKVQLKFNTGSGTSTVNSSVLVKPGHWHHLVVNRNRRNAALSVDNETPVEGQSPPGTDGLNLDTHLFIGGVTDDMIQDVKERTTVSTGLVGCIRLLDVNNMVYNLQENGANVLYGSAVGECGNNPCVPNPCKNGATCQVKGAELFHCKCVNGFSGPTCADAHNPCEPDPCHPLAQCQVLPEGGYKCECPMGREGKHCRKGTAPPSVFGLADSGDSYLELKGLHSYGNDLRHKVSMTVVLLANDSNGMIFYNGQKTDGKGDFISLALNDGILEFRYDLENVNFLSLAAALKEGFKGAIQKVSITLMGRPILSMENALHSSDVSMFPYHPCATSVCQNNGRCIPQLESYECECHYGYTGLHCQNTTYEKAAGQSEAVAFNGRTFIEYHNGVTKSEKALLVNKFELSIRTEATHGLILWSGKGVERSDYMALAIVDGRVQMTYDLGSKPIVLHSSVPVNTNRWTRIKASRALRDGSLQVGNEAAVTGSSPLGATQLDTDGALWLGGLEDSSVARRLPKAYSTGFVGCVKDVLVDGVDLHLAPPPSPTPCLLL